MPPKTMCIIWHPIERHCRTTADSVTTYLHADTIGNCAAVISLSHARIHKAGCWSSTPSQLQVLATTRLLAERDHISSVRAVIPAAPGVCGANRRGRSDGADVAVQCRWRIPGGPCRGVPPGGTSPPWSCAGGPGRPAGRHIRAPAEVASAVSSLPAPYLSRMTAVLKPCQAHLACTLETSSCIA